MKKTLGIALSEAQGPLKNLINNLAGKNGEYWLNALLKMLRKEEIPELPIEIMQDLEVFQLRKITKDKLKKLIKYIESIPVVVVVIKSKIDEYDRDVLDMEIYGNFDDFCEPEKLIDRPMFTLRTNGTVVPMNRLVYTGEPNSIFKKWQEKYFPEEDDAIELSLFCKGLFELGNMYNSAIPEVPVNLD